MEHEAAIRVKVARRFPWLLSLVWPYAITGIVQKSYASALFCADALAYSSGKIDISFEIIIRREKRSEFFANYYGNFWRVALNWLRIRLNGRGVSADESDSEEREFRLHVRRLTTTRSIAEPGRRRFRRPGTPQKGLFALQW